MRTFHIAAGAVLMLAASAIADPFILSHVAVRSEGDGAIIANSGYFVTQLAAPNHENAYLDQHNVSVTPALPVWRNEFDFVMTSTWLAVDPFGPKGRLGNEPYGTGWATYATGPRGTLHAPTYTFSLAAKDGGLAVNGQLGDPVNGDGLALGFFGGRSGFAWGPSEKDSFQAHSLFSVVNGRSVDSLFIGHFVLSEPTDTLLGLPLVVGFSNRSPGPEASTLNLLPLDGAPGRQITWTNPITTGEEIPFHIESERTTFTNSLGTFTAIDIYIVSTGPYPISVAPPDDGNDDGDDDSDITPPDDTLPGPPPPPTPEPAPAPDTPKIYFDVTDIALAVRAGEPSGETLLEMLDGAGFHPQSYSAKEWKKLMIGLYNHRIAPALSPKPSKAERKATIAELISTYGIAPELADLTDTGTQDANGDGDVDFADVARILEVGGASAERLTDTLVLIGMDPQEFPTRKAWKATVKTFYAARILPEFAGDRSKKQQKKDRKALIKAR